MHTVWLFLMSLCDVFPRRFFYHSLRIWAFTPFPLYSWDVFYLHDVSIVIVQVLSYWVILQQDPLWVLAKSIIKFEDKSRLLESQRTWHLLISHLCPASEEWRLTAGSVSLNYTASSDLQTKYDAVWAIYLSIYLSNLSICLSIYAELVLFV